MPWEVPHVPEILSAVKAQMMIFTCWIHLADMLEPPGKIRPSKLTPGCHEIRHPEIAFRHPNADQQTEVYNHFSI
jgi:hypothetical protein